MSAPEISRGAEASSDLLTMLGVNPDERPEHGGPTTAETLAAAVMSAAAAAKSTEPTGRVNVVLVPAAARAIAQLVERTGMKKVDVVNRALQIFEFLDAEGRTGMDLILRGSGSEQRVRFL